MKILLATNNKNKINELSQMLDNLDVEIVAPFSLNDEEEIEETGLTFEENAFIKANYFYQKYHIRTIADDSGLCVDSLNGAPGVYSSRYAGDEGNSSLNNEKLLNELKNIGNRKAYFYSAICYINELGKVQYFDGKVEGIITRKAYGDNGFGYDPLFIPNGYEKTFSQMSDEEKNGISHRYLALVKFIDVLKVEAALEKAKNVLNAEEVTIKSRLLGGMSNYTYVVEADNNLYTLRILGENAEKFVNRHEETNNIKLFESLNITNQTIYFDEETGLKISKYVEGTPLSETDPNLYPYKKIAEVLKTIHNSKITNTNEYEPFERLDKYEKHIIDLGFVHPERYNYLRKYFNLFKDYLESGEKVFCHGDSQPSNFIFNGDEVITVDFEFSGLNDPIYDIACFSNIRLEDGLKLLKAYYGVITEENYLKFYLWRCFQAFQWYNVAMYKDLMGLSKKLHIDFKKVSENYLITIDNLYCEIERIVFNSEKK